MSFDFFQLAFWKFCRFGSNIYNASFKFLCNKFLDFAQASSLFHWVNFWVFPWGFFIMSNRIEKWLNVCSSAMMPYQKCMDGLILVKTYIVKTQPYLNCMANFGDEFLVGSVESFWPGEGHDLTHPQRFLVSGWPSTHGHRVKAEGSVSLALDVVDPVQLTIGVQDWRDISAALWDLW